MGPDPDTVWTHSFPEGVISEINSGDEEGELFVKISVDTGESIRLSTSSMDTIAGAWLQHKE